MLYLFNIGDKIVYPSQGVGIIDSIEEKEFLGKMKKYCRIHLINNNLKLMMPLDRLLSSNIRPIASSYILDDALNHIETFTHDVHNLTTVPCKERIANNTIKFKSGTLKDFIEVICNLTEIKKEHSLNNSESQMLKNTRKFLIDEISLIKNISDSEASDLLDDSLSVI
ncbi:CarD family transcriptional regulator [Clostridium baratii]|uniref:CarD family transcriptional regulator n=1 Tax=Clostridium baratii TaxID=1561 RepID=UPI001FA89EB1|nr:CarD family transcriptional regulator [Clostridium baratii]